MMKVEDILEILSIPLFSASSRKAPPCWKASNVGTPVVFDLEVECRKAYEDAVSRLIGEQLEMKIQPERRGLFQRLLRRTA